MKNKFFFINVFSNFVIVLIITSLLILTTNSNPIRHTSGDTYSAIYRGDPTKNNVSLMINVYWGTEFIEPMLEVLTKEGVKTTFFVGGSWANANSDVLEKIVQAGHEVGNHGYYHKDHAHITKERNREEIYITHQLIKALVDVEMDLFAPPSGSFNDTTLEVAKNLGYKTIMWTRDTIDWRDKNSSIVLERATRDPQNGNLILMHPTQHTLDVLEAIIKFYKEQGFNVTTVSEAL